MKKIIKFTTLVLFTSLIAACSKGPSDGDVKDLVEAQYDQANSMMHSAMSGVKGTEMESAMNDMMAGMMPKLEAVDNINCDEAEGENTYLCTADITQTISGEKRTDETNFKVHKVNDEWVLRQ